MTINQNLINYYGHPTNIPFSYIELIKYSFILIKFSKLLFYIFNYVIRYIVKNLMLKYQSLYT